MANLLLTNSCNRSCPYCFALKEKGEKTGFLSRENLRQVLEFLKSSGTRDISLLGGEPTLHPEFGSILNYILGEGFRVKVFSNALIRPESLNALVKTESPGLNVILNVNHPHQNSRQEWRRILKTLEMLGPKATLAYNIYQSQLELDFIPELIKKYKLYRAVRLGIAQPIWGAGNAYVPLEKYFTIGPQIVAFAKECDKYDIRPYFDCGFILCMFSEAEIGQLYYSGVMFNFYCSPAIDFGPNLDVWHCFPLSKCFRKNLRDFTSCLEISKFYTEKFQPLRIFGTMERCANCKYLGRQQCSGGCLAHKLRVFHMEPPTEEEKKRSTGAA